MSEAIETRSIQDILPEVLTEIAQNKELIRTIDDTLATEHNVPRGTFVELVANTEKVQQLSDEEIAFYTVALHKVTENVKIDPSIFFTQKQVKAAAKYKYEDEKAIEYPYTLRHVTEFPTGRDYITYISFQEIAALWNAGVITYNFQTQRLSKKRLSKRTGQIVEKEDVQQKSVKAITKLMVEGKYKPDALLLNILVDGNDKITFEDGQLTIFEGTTINLIDGMHRLTAILNVLEEEPNIEGYIGVQIKHYPLEEAQFLLGQINTVNPFDKTLVKHYKAETIGAQIAKDLMNIHEFKNRISIKTALDKKLNLLTNFAILSDTIESVFEPQNAKDRYDILDALKKFFGYFMANYEDQFGKEKSKLIETSWFVHHNMFVGFIALAGKLYKKYGKDFPVDDIVKVIDSINFEKKEGTQLNNLMAGQGKVNSNKVKGEIRKLFEEQADKLLK
nr:DNA sulfur modification protein DndB [Mycobacterium sp. E3298]